MRAIPLSNLEKVSRAVRAKILEMTTKAGSGHPTSSLSAVEVGVSLFFGGLFKDYRFVLSKGHASPLLYALYWAGGRLIERDLEGYRSIDSVLEGHPTPRFSEVMVATGSLGQGLSVGLGMAWGLRFAKKKEKVFVLTGDSELSEGSVWEAVILAPKLSLSNLVWLIDMNRLGQRGETIWGHRAKELKEQIKSFGWDVKIVKKGNDISSCLKALALAKTQKRPLALLFITKKGAGISFLEDKEGWHGKPLNQEQLYMALKELGDYSLGFSPRAFFPNPKPLNLQDLSFKKKDYTGNLVLPQNGLLAPRKAWIEGVLKVAQTEPVIVLDAEVSNSTYTGVFQKVFPERFVECYIAEQNMAGMGLGFSVLGFKVVMATFSAFWTRAFDQLRMAQYSGAKFLVAGTHPGVSIGKDGPSQMGLEDISMFSSFRNSVVLYPADAISSKKLTEESLYNLSGIMYLRLTRASLPQIYSTSEKFKIGGLKILKEKGNVLLLGAGITLHESLKASYLLEKEGIRCMVADLYSLKPLPEKELKDIAEKSKLVVITEDHYPEGGIGERISSLLGPERVVSLSVKKLPRSGSSEDLLKFSGIHHSAIKKTVKRFLRT